ncbi:MAG: AMP-dependent synthetase, partial [Alphaproteobacteria bacterium HGW-Alphaproteobacteria-13]
MPSALDLRLDAAYDMITGPGGPIEVGTVERFGRPLPFITNAPSNIVDYIAYFCAEHGDKTFLVEGEERLSFKQFHAAARKVAAALVDGHGVR